jgi:Uma2 family endonuclease
MAQRIAPPPATATDKWTYERYLRETAEGEYFTIIAGEKIMSPSPTSYHQDILGNLYTLLRAWVRQTRAGKVKLAPFDVILAEDEVTQPDLMIVLTPNLSRLAERNVKGAPDLVVEILSPGSVRLDRERRRVLYARHGVPEYWIVSPGERTVEVLRLQGDHYDLAGLYEEGDVLQSPMLTHFTCTVKDIFED